MYECQHLQLCSALWPCVLSPDLSQSVCRRQFERQLRRVDLMSSPVLQHNTHALDGVADEEARVGGFAKSCAVQLYSSPISQAIPLVLITQPWLHLPFSTAGMNCGGIAVPTISFTNSRVSLFSDSPSPLAWSSSGDIGSMKPVTRPYWPCPPLCFLWR